jgi:hypothetical protein
MLLTEIRQCYVELNKFWTEEISRASEALRMGRVDPTDLERWKNFHANLKQTIESWKVRYGSYSCAHYQLVKTRCSERAAKW